MRQKNILLIEANLDGTVGGSHHCLFEIVKHLNRDKYIPTVLFFQDNPLINDFRKVCNVSILKQHHGLNLAKDVPKLYRHIEGSEFLKIIFLLFQKTHNFFKYYIPGLFFKYKYLKTNCIDLVHANNTPDLTDWLIVSKYLNIKIVSHLRFPWSPTKTRKMFLRYYDKVISISNYVADQLAEKGIPRENVVTIYDGIDIRSIDNDDRAGNDIHQEFGIYGNSPVIGVIGNIRRWKGQHVAIESVRRLVNRHKGITCLFIGEISNSEHDIEYLKYLKDLTREYKIEKNIIFTGYRKDIYDILFQIDILVHTSIWPEPLGRVILEGMVFRKPVIATNHGGPTETIENGISGFLVPPDDPKVLSDKISYLIENTDIAKKIGENARKRVEEKFSIEGNVRKIEEIYANLLESRFASP